jgi:hypothetical protein
MWSISRQAHEEFQRNPWACSTQVQLVCLFVLLNCAVTSEMRSLYAKFTWTHIFKSVRRNCYRIRIKSHMNGVSVTLNLMPYLMKINSDHQKMETQKLLADVFTILTSVGTASATLEQYLLLSQNLSVPYRSLHLIYVLLTEAIYFLHVFLECVSNKFVFFLCLTTLCQNDREYWIGRTWENA